MQFHSPATYPRVTALSVALLFLGGCHKGAAPPESSAPESAAATADKDAANVSLSAEDRQKLGVATVDLKAASWSSEINGFAVVVSHDGIAQAVAELASAQAAERQSRAAAARAHELAGSAGALSLETAESAERQAALDAAALALAERRLSSVIGEHPVWLSGPPDANLRALAGGRSKLIRATFPMGGSLPQQPPSLRFSRVAAKAGERGWDARSPWPAQADPSVPGRSFFAELSGTDLSEGERLEAWVPTGDALKGWLIPASAVVQAEDKYWCYIEKPPGKYRRVLIDIERPLDEGYFVSEGFDGGQQVVTSAAALLLARELNPSTEAE